MQLAIELATRQRDQVRLDLEQERQGLQFAQEQLNQLEGYSQDTQARWVTRSNSHSTSELMRHYYQFMDKLHQAMTLQRQVVQDAEQRVRSQQATLLQAEFKLASRQTVRNNMLAAVNMRRDKQEQKQLDEMAALQHRTMRAGHYLGDER